MESYGCPTTITRMLDGCRHHGAGYRSLTVEVQGASGQRLMANMGGGPVVSLAMAMAAAAQHDDAQRALHESLLEGWASIRKRAPKDLPAGLTWVLATLQL